MSGNNRFAYEGRFDKAWKIVRWVQRSELDLETVAGWSEAQWEVAAGMIGLKNPPSEKCVGIAIGLLAPAPHKKAL